ncbi:hypothetical protein FJM65_11140 [Pontibacter mangrovi]|uniref:Transmembrane Fragile-X-F protein n=1 Tax=Pontibacter mangrovi TaxID=2589816 RepID=A0A501W5G6_9BACT|nr:hypothetical protein FJM65_11140 [Pontibacter mangrovi]
MAQTNNNIGIGFWPLLFLIFLVLKLTKVIAWSWWWVTLPLYGPVLLIILIVVGVFAYRAWKERRRANGLR